VTLLYLTGTKAPVRLGSLSISVSSELNDEIEIIDDDVAVLGSLAHDITISKIKTDVVHGSDEVANPVSRSLDESIHQSHGSLKIWHGGKYGSESGIGNREGNECKRHNLLDHDGVSIHGAGQ